MEDKKFVNGQIRECCTREEFNIERPREDILVRVCKTCGARHIEVSVDPGRIFSRGA